MHRAFAIATVLASLAACTAIEPPPTRETIHVRGDAYARGLSHGTQLRSKVRSFFTTMLTASLLPYLNREKADIAGALTLYAGEKYAEDFSYKLLLESALKMKTHLSDDLIAEMKGVADGSGLAFEDVLILNSFVDSVMCVRGVALALRLSRAPDLESISFIGTLAGDKVDNDADGKTDEADEGVIPYQPSPIAVAVEVPVDAKLRWVIADPDGVDEKTLRCQLDDRVFTHDDPAFSFKQIAATKDSPAKVEVTLTPPGGLPAAAVVSLIIMAGDKDIVVDPPPAKARFMRDERVAFTTAGADKETWEVANIGVDDGRSQPPSSGFALTKTATADGKPILAQHFSLLDANSSHKHTMVLIHHPTGGKPFVTVGWAGVIWGFSGMNSRGLAGVVNYSDTLRNSVVNGLLPHISNLHEAALVTDGVPIGLTLRKLLEEDDDAAIAANKLKKIKHTFGWNLLLADAKDQLRAAEVDSMGGGRAFVWGPGKDPAGQDSRKRPLSSVGVDDLRMSVHFVKNTEDMFSLSAAAPNGVPIKIRKQRGWSSYYFRSLRTFGELGNMISRDYGKIDVASAKAMLAHKALVDTSDGMNAVVLEPARLRLHTAMGSVPATDSVFETVEVPAE